MIFIFGGAYQGKLDAALARTGLSAEDCCDCGAGLDLSRTVLNHFEEYVGALAQGEEDAAGQVALLLPRLKDKVIVMDDISCGVVPLSPALRRWREEAGRCAVLLSREADEVLRVFCGIVTKLK